MEFKRTEVAGTTGVDQYRLQFYIAQGVYDKLKEPVRGKPTYLSERHLIETFLIKELDRRGVALSAIRGVLKQLRKYQLFQNHFKSGRLKKSFRDEKVPHIYVIFYDEPDKVDLWDVAGKGTEVKFDMKGYRSAIVVDLTEAFITVANL